MTPSTSGFGVGLARQLQIPGEELTGVTDAIGFIYDIRTKVLSGRSCRRYVAVIGMGMTAIDAAPRRGGLVQKR